MSALHTAVLNAFQSQQWSYREVPGMEVVESSFEAYHGKVLLHVQSFGEAQIVSVVANVSLAVPASHKARSAELLMRANKELNLGAFEMEWDSGVVMFRQANLFPKDHAAEDLIASLVHNVILEADRMTPFLGELCRTSQAMLPLLDLPQLLLREDLLPPAPDIEGKS
ncbi:MAG: YbjN domain-containing protein [Roseimicrobium sp.]